MKDTAIYSSIKKSNLDDLKRNLNKNIDLLGEYACTALHYACREGNLEIVKFLIENGADVNKQNQYATIYPLFEVMQSKNHEKQVSLIDLLIHAGADVHCVDSFGNTLLHHAVEQENIALINLLIGSGVEVNKTLRHDKDTALHYACFKKNKDIFLFLVENGAKRDNLNIYFKTAESYL